MTVKRIWPRVSGETGQEARDEAARIASERIGTLEGVEVDLTHPLLPLGEWEPMPWWSVWGGSPDHAGLMFPSAAKDGGAALRKEAAGAVVYVRPGDCVTVEAVEIAASDARFDHPHDKEVRLATLRVERPTGEVLHSPGPLGFYGTGRIQKHGTREAFDHVIARILAHAGVDGFAPRSIDAPYSPLWSQPLEQIALLIAEQAHRSFFSLADELPPDGEGKLEMAHLRAVANNAALAGFLLAKLEAREPERKMGKVIENAAFAAASRKNTGLLDAGRALAATHPKWTRNRIAKALQEQFPDKELSSINRSLRNEGIGPSPA